MVAILFVIGLFVVAAFILYKFKRQGYVASLSGRGVFAPAAGCGERRVSGPVPQL